MVIKIGWDAGHGYNTPGKRTPDGEREWTFNDIVGRAFANELSHYEGVATKRFDDPTGKTDVPLQTRTKQANAWGAHYFISFHHNANTGKWGDWTGVETFVYTNASKASMALAQAVHLALVAAYGLRDRGIKKGNLHMVRETRMPSILIEGGFMDSAIDIKKLRDRKVLENAGKMIAQALAKHLKLKRSNTAQKEENSMSQPTYKKDAPPSDWAKEAVEWAKNTKPTPITDGTYLQRPATREEVLVMLYRMSKSSK